MPRAGEKDYDHDRIIGANVSVSVEPRDFAVIGGSSAGNEAGSDSRGSCHSVVGLQFRAAMVSLPSYGGLTHSLQKDAVMTVHSADHSKWYCLEGVDWEIGRWRGRLAALRQCVKIRRDTFS